jgi:5-formyltetrahydrofolate cyclo-ligase
MATKAATKRIKKPDPQAKRKLAEAIERQTLGEYASEIIAEPDPDMDELHRRLIRYDNEHQLAKGWEEKRKETQQEVLPELKEAGKTKALTEREELTFTPVKTERAKINSEKLKKALGAKTFNKYTSPQLDEDKIEAGIKLGQLDPNIVAQCSETTESEFIKVSRKARKDR